MQKKVHITDEQVAQYQRDGAILLKGILTNDEQKLLESGFEESFANPGKRFSRASSPDGEGETFMESFSCQGNAYFKDLLKIGRIPEIAARMMKATSAQLILDQIFYKAKGKIIPTPWHQDTPYLRVRGDDMIRVWITSDFSPKELTLQIVRGSHRWNVVYDPRIGSAGLVKKSGQGRIIEMSENPTAAPKVPDIEKYRDSFDILTWDVEPGDALVFNGNMIHSAGGAENAPTARRAYTTMWGGPDLQYITPPDNALPTLAEVQGISVPPGARIGDYRNAFPVGWEEDELAVESL